MITIKLDNTVNLKFFILSFINLENIKLDHKLMAQSKALQALSISKFEQLQHLEDQEIDGYLFEEDLVS